MFLRLIGIPMGTKSAALIADLFFTVIFNNIWKLNLFNIAILRVIDDRSLMKIICKTNQMKLDDENKYRLFCSVLNLTSKGYSIKLKMLLIVFCRHFCSFWQYNVSSTYWNSNWNEKCWSHCWFFCYKHSLIVTCVITYVMKSVCVYDTIITLWLL
jgi:hypothetical protein